MSELNSIYYRDASKQLLVNNTTNELIISGYRLVVDSDLNRDLVPVAAPAEISSLGKKGNIAFDRNYVYYCVEDNSWKRAPLAKWRVSSKGSNVQIPIPSHWWNLTNPNPVNGMGFAERGDYNFYTYSATPAENPTFNSSGAFLKSSNGIDRSRFPAGVSLLNYSSNLVEPSSFNQDFTISFETKRLNINGIHGGQFILGNRYGKLGFHFEYTNINGASTGNYISFKFATGSPGFASIQSVNTGITDQNYHQVVAMNDAYNKAISLYVDGVLQGSGKYPSARSLYSNPVHQGFAIGASVNNNLNTPSNSTELNTPIIIRNMGFWKGAVLTSGQVQYLYNKGSFRNLSGLS